MLRKIMDHLPIKLFQDHLHSKFSEYAEYSPLSSGEQNLDFHLTFLSPLFSV